MTNKRYAIVRVDMIERKDGNTFVCPEHFEGINGRWLCSNYHKGKFVTSGQCKNCRYGDTKEQLIKKVAQVLIKEALKIIEIELGERGLKRVYEMQLKVAKKIVEFLGVK